MSLIKFKFMFIFLILLIISPKTMASEITISEVKKMNMKQILDLLNSPNWQDRDLAVNYGVDRFIENDTVKIALIKLLEKEIQISENWWEDYERTNGNIEYLNEKYGFGEGYGEYEFELIDKVIQLKDKRALNALVAVAHWGNKPSKAVAEFGRDAIKPLMDWFEKTKNPTSKDGVIEAFGKIFECCKFDSNVTVKSPVNLIPTEEKNKIIEFLSKILQEGEALKSFKAIRVLRQIGEPSTKPKIRETLVNMLSHEAVTYRIDAIKILAEMGDTSVIPRLKEVAEKDTWKKTIDASERGGKKGNKMTIYPVREAAEKALKNIKERENIESDSVRYDTKKK